MNIINANSLYRTLDNLNQTISDCKVLSSSEKKQIAKWIAGRQGLKGSYANMFAPTESDFKEIKLFTGDKLNSKASIGHILGEESLRALFLLNVNDEKINKALKDASSGIDKVVKRNYELGNYAVGTFCCGKCSVAYWRNISAEGVSKNKKYLEGGMKYLKSMRDGKGKWGRFPFFYTILALTDIDLPSAKEEIKYASDILKRYVMRKGKDTVYSKRNKEIAKRALELSIEY